MERLPVPAEMSRGEAYLSLRPPNQVEHVKMSCLPFPVSSFMPLNVLLSTSRAFSNLHPFMNINKTGIGIHILHEFGGPKACLLGFLIHSSSLWWHRQDHYSSRSSCISTWGTSNTEGNAVIWVSCVPGHQSPAQQSGWSGQDCPEGQFQWMSLLTSNLIFRSDATQGRVFSNQNLVAGQMLPVGSEQRSCGC